MAGRGKSKTLEDASAGLFADISKAVPLPPAAASPSTQALKLAKKAPKPDKPHHAGHRERLRKRFADHGADSLADYELLELLLFRSIPRADTKPLAKALLAEFGDFAAVLGAEPARIAAVAGAGAAVALDLKTIHAAFARAGRTEAQRRPIVSSWKQLTSYCASVLAHETREHFRVLFLDRKNQLIRDEEQSRGTVDHAPVFPREVVRRALDLGASALILVHNHPSGDPSPSAADVAITHEVIAAAKTMGIAVHDHLILGRNGATSLKTLGLM